MDIINRIAEIINNFSDWYTALWYDTFGETGVTIIQGVSGLVFVAAMLFLGGCLIKKVIGKLSN